MFRFHYNFCSASPFALFACVLKWYREAKKQQLPSKEKKKLSSKGKFHIFSIPRQLRAWGEVETSSYSRIIPRHLRHVFEWFLTANFIFMRIKIFSYIVARENAAWVVKFSPQSVSRIIKAALRGSVLGFGVILIRLLRAFALKSRDSRNLLTYKVCSFVHLGWSSSRELFVYKKIININYAD